MKLKALLCGMCRACIEHAQHVREEGGKHWRRHWEKAMQDAATTRRMMTKA